MCTSERPWDGEGGTCATWCRDGRVMGTEGDTEATEARETRWGISAVIQEVGRRPETSGGQGWWTSGGFSRCSEGKSTDWKQREKGEPTKQPHLLLNPDSVQIRERHVFPRDLASTKPIGGECPGSYSAPTLLQSSPERKTPGPSPEEGDWGGAGGGGTPERSGEDALTTGFRRSGILSFMRL